mgnify:CR=1 FL=1
MNVYRNPVTTPPNINYRKWALSNTEELRKLISTKGYTPEGLERFIEDKTKLPSNPINALWTKSLLEMPLNMPSKILFVVLAESAKRCHQEV